MAAPAPLPPPPPPPPPPMPEGRLNEPAGGLTLDLVNPSGDIKPHLKMRTLNWRRIPKRRVLASVASNSLTDPNKTPRQQKTTSPRRNKDDDTHNEDEGEEEEDEDEDEEGETNIWFLIAKANKSIKRVDQEKARTNNSTSSSTKTTTGRLQLDKPLTSASNSSASRIREMLEAARRRMAAVTATTTTPTNITTLTASTPTACSSPQSTSRRESVDSLGGAFDRLNLSLSGSAVKVNRQLSASAPPPPTRPKSVLEAIDFHGLESLFCLNNQPLLMANDDANDQTTAFVRRSSWRTNASCDSVISSNSYGSNQHLYDHDGMMMYDYEGPYTDEEDGDYDESGEDGDEQDGDDHDDDSFELMNENILDSKKSLNVNIFLKQLKNQSEFIGLIDGCQHSQIGHEKLDILLKLLPDEQEQVQLMKFYARNKHARLPVAERFLLQMLVEVANLELKIKFMLLKEKYESDIEQMIPSELDKLDVAVGELRHSKALRQLLNLVLVTGNFLNSGGYAANAAGFSLDCLDRLSEVRSNRDGIYLIHYVAEIAHKMQLIGLERGDQGELAHLESASRVCLESIKLDLVSMVEKIQELKGDIERANVVDEDDDDDDDDDADDINSNTSHEHSLLATVTKQSVNRSSRIHRGHRQRAHETSQRTSVKLTRASKRKRETAANQKEFLLNLLRTLEDIKCNVESMKRRLTVDLENTRLKLANYLCEDPSTFNLHDCFRSILTFCQRLKVASDENERRQRVEMARAKSGGCNLKRSNTINPRLPNRSRASLGGGGGGGALTQVIGTSGLESSRASFGGYISSADQRVTQPARATNIPTANLRRTSSNCSSFVKSSMSSLSSQTTTCSTATTSTNGGGCLIGEYDDLHEGLMQLLSDTNNRRYSDIHRGTSSGGNLTSANQSTTANAKTRGSYVSHRRRLFNH